MYCVFEEPEYLGLTAEDMSDDSLILKFSVLEEIDEKKSILESGNYKKRELEYIQEIKPLTQLETSDRQLKSIEKISRVQTKMREQGFRIE